MSRKKKSSWSSYKANNQKERTREKKKRSNEQSLQIVPAYCVINFAERKLV